MRHDSHYVEEFARTTRSVGRVLPINQIVPNPEQPRVDIGDLTELSSSIEQNGVLEPLLVKPNGNGTWMIIAGERRWRAANLAGLSEVPCIELDIDEKSIAEIALIENLQRKDLTIWEEADGFAYLIERFGYTHEEIAKKIGKSRTTVTESMAIAGLPESIRIKCRQSEINAKSTLLEIARQFDEEAMHNFLDNLGTKSYKRQKNLSQLKSKVNSTQTTQTENITLSVNEKSFLYKSPNKEFILNISFNNADSFDNKDVLRALKEVFVNVNKSTS
jgi:ParB family chromosome partitioning protein